MGGRNGLRASPQTGRLAALDPLQPVRNILFVGGQQAAQSRGTGFATIQQRCLVCGRHVQLHACSGSSIPTVADDVIGPRSDPALIDWGKTRAAR
jgi:hypothetical protein